MSVRKQALKYTAAALVVATFIIAASTVYLNPSNGGGNTSTSNSSGQLGGTAAKLVVQLTDPPTVPKGTTSLNLTYSSINLLAGEPASNGQQTTNTLTVTPQGGSATVDLLRLQNISQTIASANLPNGSIIYSFSFAVTGISIDVNGTVSPVTLATGGGTLTVTLARPASLAGTNIALLQLNPVIVSTPSGYQMIPSAVGIVRAASAGDQGRDQIGSQQQLSSQDKNQLQDAQGNLTANLKSLSVSGNVTSISVEVNNTGSISVVLTAIGVHGNFTAAGLSCGTHGNESTGSDGHGSESNQSSTTTTTTEAGGSEPHATVTTTTTSTSTESSHESAGCEMEHSDQIVFVPVNSTLSGSGCVSLKMQLVTGNVGDNGSHGLTLGPGQCVDLTYVGALAFGHSAFVLVPSTASGQVYVIHIIASEGSNIQLSCSIPVNSASCNAIHQVED